jgi:gliding motility-associated-like protein
LPGTMCIVSTVNFIKKYSLVLVIVMLAGLPVTGYAQLCSGSLGDPVVKIDFGAGSSVHAPALPAGTTSYANSSSDFPNDGSYTIENTTAGSGNVWWSTKDHTGNTGYMMVVNASSLKTDYFYKTTVRGLCSGTTFEFAAWAANLIRTTDVSPPDLTFTILKTDGVSVLATVNTGAIPVTPGGLTWKQYGTSFKMPVGESDVIVQITNNSPGGIPGNDLVLDDITFRPCGPNVSSSFIVDNFQPTVQNACTGNNQSYTLNSTVVNSVYVNPSYQWQVNAGSVWTNIAGANTTTCTVNQPTVAGTYQYRMVTAEAANIGSSFCQVSSNVLTLTVGNSPIAAFIATNSNANCLLKTADFKDKSTPNGTLITSWKWDFGDGETSVDANPSHTYATPGDYPVKLTVANSTGCESSSQQIVNIAPKVVVNFDVTVSLCPNSPVTFTDKSTSADPIIQWHWSFDDGTPALILTSGAPFTHTFATTGDHKVSLEVTTSKSCVSDIFSKTVAAAAANFTICPGDVTQFTDATVKPGTPGFTFSWDFGDGAATVANPNTSSLQNPTHKYVNAGNYTVTLTVSAQNGCPPSVQQKTFTATGLPIANFEIENKAILCGSDSVTFIDKTDVNSNIKRLVWFYDVDNHPTDSVVITQAKMRSDKKYRYFYGPNNTTAPQTYHALLIARIGGPCPDPTFKQDVVINPNPVAVLSVNGTKLISPFVLCLDAGPINIKTSANVPGKPTFAGEGITADGVFDPKVSGTGTFTINYLYTADNTGCTYTTTFKITVGPLPVITLAQTATALEGQQTTLNPGVSGSNLKYSWSPVTGISDATALNPFFSPKLDTKYTLTVTTANGCSASAEIAITVLKTPVVPNTFTPNNDGINDTWNIKYLDAYPTAIVEVFNRNGSKVFSSNNYTVPWNGKYNGAILPFGVYYYIIDTKSGRKPITGSLTIIK